MAVQFAKAHMSAVERSSHASTGGARDALSKRLLTAASAAALATATPALVAPANAQLPAECAPINPADGDTVTCTGSITGEISTAVADLTVNIGVDGGDAATVTVTSGDAVRLRGDGSQTVNVSAGSSVSGSGGAASPAGVGAFSLNGGDVAINAQGQITGQFGGVEASTGGSGNITIVATDVTAIDGVGLSASLADGATGNLSITTTGLVTGGDDDGTNDAGMSVTNNGSGTMTINVADVTANDYGVLAIAGLNAVGSNMSVTSTGLIQAEKFGVYVLDLAGGRVELDLARVSSNTDVGINVKSFSGATGDIEIDASGLVEAEKEGVKVVNEGTGGVVLDLTSVTSDALAGVYVDNQSASVGNVLVEASGVVTGYTRGVDVRNQGSGSVTLNLADATGTTQEGVFVSSTDNSNSDISVTASGAVSGATHGVNVDNDSHGGVTVDVAGAVTGTANNGVNVDNDYYGGAVSITAGGAVIGGENGVFVENAAYGSGKVDIRVAGVTGESAAGIRVANTDTGFGGDTDIEATGAVVGETNGIEVTTLGTGGVTLDLASVTGTTNRGVSVRSGLNSQAGEGGVSITATGAVSSASNGVYVRNFNTGEVMLDLVSVASDGNAIDVEGAGDVSIKVSGDVSGGAGGIGAGIYAESSGGGIEIDVADVTAAGRVGIDTRITAGDGDILIDATGTVTGSRGILAVNDGDGRVTINAANVEAGSASAISVDSLVAGRGGDISITATGMVQSTSSRGVSVINNGRGAVEMNLVSVSSGIDSGVSLRNLSDSTGNTLIRASGTISGVRGLEVSQAGTGAVEIDIASVNATTGHGVLVNKTNTAGGDILVKASGSIFTDAMLGSGAAGVEVRNQGAGDITLDLASVTGALVQGVLVSNGANSTGDISITASGTVVGGFGGVNVTNEGAGGVELDVASVAVSFAEAIRVSSGANSMGDISIIASDLVNGDNGGVVVTNEGAGNVMLDVAGVMASRGTGILVTNDSSATGDIEIKASAAVTGADLGVSVENDGTGAVTLAVNTVTINNVTGTGDTGVYVSSSNAAAGDISITATGTVSGGAEAVEVRNLGAGDVLLTALGDLSSASAGAVQIDNQGSGGVTVDIAGNVTKTVSAGVNVLNAGDGGVSISVGGNVSGGGNGIAADNAGNGDLLIAVGGDIDITTSAGVQATNRGDGDLSISTEGAVRNNGLGFGLLVDNKGDGDVTVVARGDVSGSFEGVSVFNSGAGATEITLAGAVSTSSADAFGLRTNAPAGASVTLEAGAAVAGGAEAGAIDFDGDGADVLTLNAGASVNGLVRFNNGDDSLRLAGGTFTEIQGGEGNNTVFLSGSSQTVDGLSNGEEGAPLSGFETLSIDGDGLTLGGVFSGFESVTFLAGANTLAGTIEADQVSVAPGAELIAGELTAAAASSVSGISLSNVSATVIDGDLINSGVLNIAGDGVIGRLQVTGDFTQEEGAALIMDVTDAATDVLSVGGDVVVAGDLVVEGSLAGTQAGDNPIRLIEGGGTLSGRLNIVADDGVLVQRELVFDDAGGNVDLVVTLNDLSAVEGLNSNQNAIGNVILALIGDENLDPGLADYISAVLGLDTDEEVRTALAQLHPEALDAGLQSFTASQRMFTEGVLMRSEGGRAGANERAVKLRNGATMWASVQGAVLGRDGREENTGFDGGVYAVSGGVDGLTAGRFSLGVAGGFSEFDGETDGSFGDGLDMQSYHVGVSFGLDLDDAVADGWLMRIDAATAYAAGETTLSMSLLNPENGGRLGQQGEADIRSFDLSGRFTLDGLRGERWPLRPHAEFGVQAYRQDAMRIGLGEPTGLQVDELDNTVGFAGVGLSYERQWGEALIARGRATGVRYYGDTQNVFNSRFAAAPDGPAFQTAGQEIDTQLELEAALTYRHKSGFAASLAAFGETGDLDVYGARFAISRKF